MAEFNVKKGTCLKDKTLIVDKDGILKTANEYGQISPGQDSRKLGKLRYLLKISQISEIIYVADGGCTLKTYRFRNNCLYKEGYADPLLCPTSRLLAVEELGTVDQFSGI